MRTEPAKGAAAIPFSAARPRGSSGSPFVGTRGVAIGLTIGVVGKPNVGKSTFFNAATAGHAEVGNYPFTTIDANRGVAYVRTPCAHAALGLPGCNPRHGSCRGGTRFVPVETVDVAGLVPGAHLGKGLGNRFLDDLRQAHALVHIVDASGSTDAEGGPVPVGTHDPLGDVAFLERELEHWIAGILGDGWERTAKKAELDKEPLARFLGAKLTGLGVSEAHLKRALAHAGLDAAHPSRWGPDQLLAAAKAIRREAKPILLAANKVDQAPPKNVGAMRALAKDGTPVTFCSAESELALRKAAEHGLISYVPGAATFEPTPTSPMSAAQRGALDYIRTHVLAPYGSTGIQATLETAAYTMLNLMVVYPVEDETHYKDKQGRVLPDAHLVPRGTTAKELAFRVHTDLGQHFIRALDAKTKRVIGHDHELKDGDVVKIVADA